MKHALAQARSQQAAMSSPATAAGDGYADCGAPIWNLASWDRFKAQFGHDPFSREELPPDLETAPAAVFLRLGLRVPPFAR